MKRDVYKEKRVGYSLILICLLVLSLTLTENIYGQKKEVTRLRIFYGGALMGQLEPCG